MVKRIEPVNDKLTEFRRRRQTGASTWARSEASGTNSVDYCTISYSAASGGAAWPVYVSDGNVEGGTNTGWLFASPPASTFNPLFLSGD